MHTARLADDRPSLAPSMAGREHHSRPPFEHVAAPVSGGPACAALDLGRPERAWMSAQELPITEELVRRLREAGL